MKTTFLILTVIVTSNLFAQNPIPNPGFENWTSGEPEGWLCHSYLNPASPFIYASTGHSGNFSLKGSPQYVNGTLTSPRADVGALSNPAFPVSQSYTCITFWYRCNLLAGDDFNMNLNIWDSTSNLAADADFNTPASVPAWTFASIPLIYYLSTPLRDGSLEFSLNNYLIPDAGDINSWFEVDDVEFCNTGVGINHLYENSTFIKCNPNPVSSTMNVFINKRNLNQVTFILKDIFGQTVFTKHEESLNSNYSKTFDWSFLSNGIYLLEINVDAERSVRKIIKQ